MSILVGKNTKLIVQGITGGAGSFHAKQMIEYGTSVVGGVTPTRGGEKFEGKVPVFDTVDQAVKATGANARIRSAARAERMRGLRITSGGPSGTLRRPWRR